MSEMQLQHAKKKQGTVENYNIYTSIAKHI